MPPGFQAVFLTGLPPKAIEPLLREQIVECRSKLLWDPSRVAQGLLFQAELRALTGMALADAEGRVAGYACWESDGTQTAFTDFYVSPQFRSAGANTELLRQCLEHLRPGRGPITLSPAIPHPIDIDALPIPPRVSETAAEAAPLSQFCAGSDGEDSAAAVTVRPWDNTYQDAAAELLPSSYTRQMIAEPDELIGPVAARAFIESVIHIQADFAFLPEASYVAIERESGKLCGFVLLSHAMQGVTHGKFLCVGPRVAGHRLGKRLSITAFLAARRIGYHTITLRRRTTDPRLARFYARMGFVFQFIQPLYEWPSVPVEGPDEATDLRA